MVFFMMGNVVAQTNTIQINAAFFAAMSPPVTGDVPINGTWISADGFFAFVGSGNDGRWRQGQGGGVFETGRNGNGYITFTTTQTSTVTFNASSTGGANTSAVGLWNAAGEAQTEASNLRTVTGTAMVEFEFENLPPGTYRIVSNDIQEGNGHNRGMRVNSVTVVQQTGGPQPTLIARFQTEGRTATPATIELTPGTNWVDGFVGAYSNNLDFSFVGGNIRWRSGSVNEQMDVNTSVGNLRTVTSVESFQGPIRVVMSVRTPSAGNVVPVGGLTMSHSGNNQTTASFTNVWQEVTFEFDHTLNGPISFEWPWNGIPAGNQANGNMRLRDIRVYSLGAVPLEAAALFTAFSVNGQAITPIPSIVSNEAAMGRTLPFGSFGENVTVAFTASRNAWVTIGEYTGSPGDTTTITTGSGIPFIPGTPVWFNVTAEDGQTTNHYLVTLTEDPAETELLTFAVSGISITPNDADMLLSLPFGMNRSALTVTFTSSPLTTVSVGGTQITSGAVVDFTRPVTFRVNAPDGSSHTDYTVTVTLGQPLAGPFSLSFVNPANPAPGTARSINVATPFVVNISGLEYMIPGTVGPWQIGGPTGTSNIRGSGNNIGSNEAESFGFEPNSDTRGLGIANVSGTVTLTMQAIAGMEGNEWGGQGANQGALNNSSVIYRIVHFGGEASGTARIIRDITLGDLVQGGTTGGTGVSVTTILTLETTFETDSGFFVIQPAWQASNTNDVGTRARTRILSMNATLAPGTAANLYAFYVDGEIAKIDSEERTVTVEMPYGTINLEDLSVEFLVSRGATAMFDGAAETSPFEFTFVDGVVVPFVVTAQAEGATRTYDVTVTIEETPNTNFLSFSLNGIEIGVDTLNGGSFELPFTGTDIKAVAVNFTTSRNIEVTVNDQGTPRVITSGEEVDFSAPVTFVVRSTITNTFFTEYVVTATRRVPSTESQLLTFTVNNFVEAAVGEITSIEVPFGTFMDAIRVTFTTSDYATVSIATLARGSTVIESGDEVDFSAGPVTFIVTSEAGGTYYAEYEIDITARAGTGLAWDFRNWTNATLANLSADAAWERVDAVRYRTNNVGATADTVRANGQPIREMLGLSFNAPTTNADRLRVDHSQTFNRLGLNGPDTEIIVPNATAGQFISITFATPTATSERWFVPTNAKTISEDSTTLGGNATPAWVVYEVIANGDVSFHANTGGLNVFRVTLSDDRPLSEDARFMNFAVVLADDTVALTPTVSGVTYTLPFGTVIDLANVEVLFTLGDENAEVTVDAKGVESGDNVDFTESPVIFRVTATAGNHVDYPISIAFGAPEAYFVSFFANDVAITPDVNGMEYTLPFDMDLSKIEIAFEVSYGAVVSIVGRLGEIESGVEVDFSQGPVTFRVIAHGGSIYNDYEVTLELGVRPIFTSFTLNEVAATTITSGDPGVIAVQLAGNLVDLFVEFTVEPSDAIVRIGERIVAAEGHVQTFTNPVTYTVTDEGSGAVVTYVVTVTDPSSIQGGLGVEVISFYPNPATEVLNITANNIRTIEVINMMGAIVISTSGSGNSHTLDISNLSSGLHFIRVTTETGVSVGRFIKQ